jgi:hypothetical protein
MGGVIYPYEVFKVDKPNPSVTDPEFGAYQLPNGEVRVLTNNYGQNQIPFTTREQADIFLAGLADKLGGQIVELNPHDYPKELNPSVSFEDRKVEVPRPQHRAEKTQSADTQPETIKPAEAKPTKPEDRAATKEADNNRPQSLEENTVDPTVYPNNWNRADAAAAEVSGSGDPSDAAAGDQAPPNAKRADAAPGGGGGGSGESFMKGAGAGLLEFLAETTEATPMMMMAINPVGALMMAPLYSWAADKMRDRANQSLYDASQTDEASAQGGAAVGYLGATIIAALFGPKGGGAVQGALPAAERMLVYRVEGAADTMLVSDGRGGLQVLETDAAEGVRTLWLNFREDQAIQLALERAGETPAIKVFELPRNLVARIMRDSVPEGSAFGNAASPCRRGWSGVREFGIHGSLLEELEAFIAGTNPTSPL